MFRYGTVYQCKPKTAIPGYGVSQRPPAMSDDDMCEYFALDLAQLYC